MNKSIKKIIATTIAISAFSTIVPAKYLNLTTVVANAAEYGLSSLKLYKGSGSSITLYKDRSYDESVAFKGSRDSYYATTNTSKVSVKFNAEDGYEAKAFLGSKTEAYDSGDDIKLNSGSNTIYIRTYKDGKFDSSNIKENVEDTYKISVRKGSTSSSSKNDDDYDYQDEIYLDELKLSGSSTNAINSYLNSSTSNSNTQISATPNKWIQDILGWKRTDANGNTLRDTWYLEQATGKYYYLKFNGYMTTDWRFINGEWHYFNEQGEMQIGWIQGKSGKWYYLNPTGEMVRNTAIDGYRLGPNGAWIK